MYSLYRVYGKISQKKIHGYCMRDTAGRFITANRSNQAAVIPSKRVFFLEHPVFRDSIHDLLNACRRSFPR